MTSPQGQVQEQTKPQFTFSSNTTSTQASKVPFSQRSIKRAPAPRQDELKDRRRNAFLRKVQNDRDERRYESRGEDIMRLEFVRRRREYEDELARNAPSPSAEEEEAELPGWGSMDVSSQVVPEEEVEEFVRDEEEEMRALLENFPDEEMEEMEGNENLWSDDADYDALFSEVLRSEEQGAGGGDGAGEEMDMS
ncbi:hypothetical protein PRZ48_012530 [Zasmidium cellare]|uniref:Uncharacterized protein n=1 Tax=Zasmidium cellare TaxID=395010 RepID=A0ABR0E546_ZASCE|nr:hypothetical protein PRZ48_012530 [Zasmidium cellare]